MKLKRKISHKILSLILLVIFIVISLPMQAYAKPVSQVAYNPEVQIIENDQLRIRKSIEQFAEDEFDITLAVDTIDSAATELIKPGASVVLVFDISATMNEQFSETKKRYEAVVEAADKFLDTFLGPGSSPNNEVSIVPYSSNIDYSAFGFNTSRINVGGKNYYDVNKNLSSAKALLSEIIYPDINGMTNVQLGINRARTYLESANNESKYIILFSDGVPNMAYQGKSAVMNNGKISEVNGYSSDFYLTNFDYGVGAMNGYTVDGFEVDPQSQDSGKNAVLLGTISEGILAKEEDVTIFSVFAHGDSMREVEKLQAEYVMMNVASGAERFFMPNNTEDLIKEFEKIGEEVESTPDLWTVEDPMAGYVKFEKLISLNGVEGETFEGIKYTNDISTLNWKLKNIAIPPIQILDGNYNERYELKYRVKFQNDMAVNTDVNYFIGKEYPTNDATWLTYYINDGTVFDTNKIKKAEFDIPRVDVNPQIYKLTYLPGETVLSGIPKGSIDNNPFSYYEGTTVTTLSGADYYSATGYEFTGWQSVDIDSNNEFLANEDFIMPSNNVVMTAQWKPQQYRIVYHGNGNTEGQAPDDNAIYDFGQEVEIKDNNGGLVQEDKIFMNWSTDAEGSSGITLSEGSLLELNSAFISQWADKDNNIHLYAQYKKSEVLEEYEIISTAEVGGSISPNGSIRVNKGENVTFTFEANNGYIIKEVLIDGITNEKAKVSGSYEFLNVKENHSIHVAFEPDVLIPEITLIVRFDSQGGGNVPSIEGIKPGSSIKVPETPKRDGYIFTGWYKENDCRTLWDFQNEKVNENTTLYAGWKKISTGGGIVDSKPSKPGNSNLPQTGGSSMNLVLLICAGICIILGIIVIRRKKSGK